MPRNDQVLKGFCPRDPITSGINVVRNFRIVNLQVGRKPESG
jgi:hypothetical protein